MNLCEYCRGCGQFGDSDDAEFYDCHYCDGTGTKKQEFRIKTDRGYVLCGARALEDAKRLLESDGYRIVE